MDKALSCPTVLASPQIKLLAESQGICEQYKADTTKSKEGFLNHTKFPPALRSHASLTTVVYMPGIDLLNTCAKRKIVFEKRTP